MFRCLFGYLSFTWCGIWFKWFWYIGFEVLNKIVYHEKLKDVPKILETPYIEKVAPYKQEIEMFKTQTFNPNLK